MVPGVQELRGENGHTISAHEKWRQGISENAPWWSKTAREWQLLV